MFTDLLRGTKIPNVIVPADLLPHMTEAVQQAHADYFAALPTYDAAVDEKEAVSDDRRAYEAARVAAARNGTKAPAAIDDLTWQGRELAADDKISAARTAINAAAKTVENTLRATENATSARAAVATDAAAASAGALDAIDNAASLLGHARARVELLTDLDVLLGIGSIEAPSKESVQYQRKAMSIRQYYEYAMTDPSWTANRNRASVNEAFAIIRDQQSALANAAYVFAERDIKRITAKLIHGPAAERERARMDVLRRRGVVFEGDTSP